MFTNLMCFLAGLTVGAFITLIVSLAVFQPWRHFPDGVHPERVRNR